MSNECLTASNYFSLEQGVRQGGPLSPSLYTVVVKAQAIEISQSQLD